MNKILTRYIPIALIIQLFFIVQLFSQTTIDVKNLSLNGNLNNNVEKSRIIFDIKNIDGNNVTLEAQIPKGYYTYIESSYANKISFSNNNNQIKTIYPNGVKKNDDIVLYGKQIFNLIFDEKINKNGSINISYQLCIEKDNICLPPIYESISIVGLDIVSNAGNNMDKNNIKSHEHNSIIEMTTDDIISSDNNIFFIGLMIFIAGMLSFFLPCTYPLIPITISIVSGRDIKNIKNNTEKIKMKIIVLSSLFFCLGLISTHTLLGAIISLAGYFLSDIILFGSIGYNPIFLSIIVLFFLFFAFSMLGFYDFQMPDVLQRMKSNSFEKSLKEDKVSLVQKFLMGSLMGIVASPCAAPIVGTIVELSILNPSAAIIYMALYALGFSVFLFVIGLSSSLITKLPKSGAWMDIVRLIFTVIMFCITFYYANTLFKVVGFEDNSRLLSVATILIFTMIVYFIRRKKIFIEKKYIIIIFAMIGFALISALIFDLNKPKKIKSISLEQAIELSKENDKDIFIDFSAIWCGNCKLLKDNVLLDEKLKSYIDENYIFVEIDVDKDKELAQKYNVRWIPWITIIDSDENIIYTKNKFSNFNEKMVDEIFNELEKL